MTDSAASGWTARLLALDARVSRRMQRLGDRSTWLRAAAIPLARSGDGWLWVGGAAIVALAGGPVTRGRALWVVAWIVATGVLVQVAKLAVRRERPAGDWGGSYRRIDPYAFPSGHSARAFLLAILTFALGPVWLGALLTVWATLIAASRVALGVHYVSDVVAGAGLGLVCGVTAAVL